VTLTVGVQRQEPELASEARPAASEYTRECWRHDQIGLMQQRRPCCVAACLVGDGAHVAIRELVLQYHGAGEADTRIDGK
jgi:hypothetical protein